MKVFSTLFVVVCSFFWFMATPAAAQECAGLPRTERTACEEVKYQSLRSTQGTPITRFADNCNWALRRTGEPLIMRAVPNGHEAWSEAARALPQLTWAGENSAGEQFRELGLSFGDGLVVVNTELCADSSVWRAALQGVGLTLQDITSGRWYIALCGENWSHHLPVQRVVNAYNGVNQRGQFSVLSKAEGRAITDRLTELGH